MDFQDGVFQGTEFTTKHRLSGVFSLGIPSWKNTHFWGVQKHLFFGVTKKCVIPKNEYIPKSGTHQKTSTHHFWWHPFLDITTCDGCHHSSSPLVIIHHHHPTSPSDITTRHHPSPPSDITTRCDGSYHPMTPTDELTLPSEVTPSEDTIRGGVTRYQISPPKKTTKQNKHNISTSTIATRQWHVPSSMPRRSSLLLPLRLFHGQSPVRVPTRRNLETSKKPHP